MSWRKWLVRGLVFGIVGAAACGALLYQRWTNPVAIRQQVLNKLRELFPGATVTLDSASLDILGGIRITDLRLRRNDPERTVIAYVPSGVLYHNKEEVLDGKLRLRKIELDRPRIHVIRGRDGRWNVADLTARARSDTPIPTVVVHQATLVLDDQYGKSGMIPVEINNVSFTMINDPLTTVSIEAAGTSDLAGALQFRGSWQRDTNEIAIAAKALGVPLSPVLVQRAGVYCQELLVKGLQLEGVADVAANLSFRPQQPLRYDVRCQLKQVSLDHPKLLPVSLENLEASLHCINGKLLLESLTAQAGQAEVQAHGVAQLPCVALNFEGAVTIKRLAVCNELVSKLPENVQNLYKLFRPSGPVTLTFDGGRREGVWEQKRCILEPESIRVVFEKFPYPLERLTGKLDCDLLRHVHKINLAAFAGTQPVTLRGTWQGLHDQTDVNLEILARDIPIDERLLSALPQKAPDIQNLARSFNPTGRGNCKVLVRHVPGMPEKQFANEYHVAFLDAAAKWNDFPFPLEHLSGVLEVHPDYWEFNGFQGTHHGGTVRLKGRSFPRQGPGPEVPMVIDIEGQDVSLDEDLRVALQRMAELQRMHSLGQAWDMFNPEGRMNFAARIDRAPGRSQDLDVAVDVRGCAAKPSFFPYALGDLSGHFRYNHNRLTATKVTARHGGTRISLREGAIDLAPSGGFYADLSDLQGYPLFPDADLLQAMPEQMREFVNSLNLHDPVILNTRLVVSQDGEPGKPPTVFWDGRAWLRDAHFQTGVDFEHVTGTVACAGRHDGRQIAELTGNVLLDQAWCFKQPLQNFHAGFQINKQAKALVLGLKAPLFGGEISGEGRIELNEMHRYELYLTALQVNLEQFGAHNFGPAHKLSGFAKGQLYLAGQGGNPDTLEGQGRIDVPEGKLIHLPFLLDLLKFLGLRSPDGTAFQEMHAVFGIQGKRVSVSQLELQGNPISLSGKGSVNLDGSDIQMDFSPTWGRTEQLLPPLMRTVPSAISKGLLRIEVRGKLGARPEDLQFTKKPVPILTDPLSRMTNKTN